MVRCGVARYGMARYGGTAWYGMVRCDRIKVERTSKKLNFFLAVSGVGGFVPGSTMCGCPECCGKVIFCSQQTLPKFLCNSANSTCIKNYSCDVPARYRTLPLPLPLSLLVLSVPFESRNMVSPRGSIPSRITCTSASALLA